MTKLKRKKQDGIDASTTCVCHEEGTSALIKCENNCINPWWHLECAGLTGITPAAARKLTWTCPCCTIHKFRDEYESDFDTNVLDADKLRDEIKVGIQHCIPSIVSEVVKQVKPNNDMVKQSLTTSFVEIMKDQAAESHYAPISKTIIKQAINEDKKEQENINNRKKNIMVFNAKESLSDDKEQSKKDDLALLKKAFNAADERILEYDDEIVSFRRFGKKSSDKIRPILVTIKTERAKRMLFGNLYKLQNDEELKSLNFNHDVTEEEKKATKERVKEAEKKTEELKNDLTLSDDEKNWIFKIRGPPWDQRMVKIRPKEQQQN